MAIDTHDTISKIAKITGGILIRSYSQSEKDEIIQMYKSGESFKNLLKLTKIPESTLYRWTKGYRQSITVNKKKLYRHDIELILNENERLKKENTLWQKSKCTSYAPLSEKLSEMIRLKEETNCDVRTLCRTFGVLRSTYYHRALRSPQKTQLEIENEELKPVIKQIFIDSKNRFGSQMIKIKMADMGYAISPRRISRLMQEMGLVCNSQKRTLAEYKRCHKKSIFYTENQLKQNFTQLHPNRAWVSDITYLRTKEKVYYLCVIIDLFSRKIIGYKLSDSLESSIVTDCLRMALAKREIGEKLIFHSDQGIQYLSVEFRSLLKKQGISQSFSKPGYPYDNAVAESFFAHFKKDEVYKNIYENFEPLHAAVKEYVHFYNVERPHYALGMLTPQQKENMYFAEKTK